MHTLELKKGLYWTGVLDPNLRVFDIVMETEFGTTYNSYILKGSEKTALFETAKLKFFDEYIEALKSIVDIKDIDYIVMNHTEPDHAGSIEKLIELSQVEADIYKFDYNNFDAAALLSVVTNELNVKLQNKDIKVTVNTSDLVKQNCYSDKNVLKTVMSNLLSNALELIETGAISINLSNPIPEFLLAKGFEVGSNVNEKSYLMFEIACKGLDATLYNNEDIFDPYVQVEKNSKKYLLQSFLLGSTKKYINKLKGEIWINNQYANQVSFVFIVPIEKSLIEEIQA